MRVFTDLMPFVLAGPVDCSDDLEPESASPVSDLKCDGPTKCTSSSSPVDNLEPDATFECPSSTGMQDPVTPVSPASLCDLHETTAPELSAPISEPKQVSPSDSSYSQEEVNAAEALPPSFTGPASNCHVKCRIWN